MQALHAAFVLYTYMYMYGYDTYVCGVLYNDVHVWVVKQDMNYSYCSVELSV